MAAVDNCFDLITKEDDNQNPAKTGAALLALSRKVGSSNGSHPTRTFYVLIAEDNPINQKVASHLLERLGYRTSVAENGAEALDLLQENHFDLVLLDIQMPVMDGYETCKAIRTSDQPWATIPIVALTANALPEVRDRCLSLGMNDFLTKPVTKEKLSLTVKKNLVSCETGSELLNVVQSSLGPQPS